MEGDEESNVEATNSEDDKCKEGENKGAPPNSKHAELEGMEKEEMSSDEVGESEKRQEMEREESGAQLGESGTEFLGAMEVSCKHT